jgi:hypothetical protein
LVREILLSEELVHEYGSYFEDKSMDELDKLAKSFSLCEFTVRARLMFSQLHPAKHLERGLNGGRKAGGLECDRHNVIHMLHVLLYRQLLHLSGCLITHHWPLDLSALRTLLLHALAARQLARDLLGFAVAIGRRVPVGARGLHAINTRLLVGDPRLGPRWRAGDVADGFLDIRDRFDHE